MPNKSEVGDALRDLMAHLGVSKERVAAEVGVTTTAILYWLSGTRVPRPRFRHRLAEFARRERASRRIIEALEAPEEAARL